MTTKAEILIVDDDPDIRDSLRIVLEANGYRIRSAANGREALAELNQQKPDLMILDIMMTTDTEGFDLAYEIERTPAFAELPIVILTSFMDKVRADGPEPFQHILGEGLPARWMFEKPVDSVQLLEKIAGLLQPRA